MKNIFTKSLLIFSIIFITGCVNKNETLNKNVNNTNKSSVTYKSLINIDCSDGYIADNIYEKLTAFDSENIRNDNYTAEIRMCKSDKKQIKVDIVESILLANKEYSNIEHRYMIVVPCGEEKKIIVRNKSLGICKGEEGLVYLTIESLYNK